MTPSAIEVKNLVKDFRKRRSAPVRAVNNISFRVESGSIFGILGPNGAGKTTTLRILTTLLLPTSGTVSVLGHDVVSKSLEVRRNIVAVLQENAVENYLSVSDNFRTFGRFHGLPRSEIQKRSERLLDIFGLREYRSEKPIDLSGGLKRRLQVAKAFMVDVPVVFLDEPTTGMDTLNKRTTLGAINEEARKGRTIVLTTHIVQEADELCHSLIIINHGSIVGSGTPAEIRSLSLKLFYLTLTFETISDELVRQLRNCGAHQMQIHNSDITITVRDQSEALRLLTCAQQFGGVRQFEMEGASLEDAFIQLLDPSGGGTP